MSVDGSLINGLFRDRTDIHPAPQGRILHRRLHRTEPGVLCVVMFPGGGHYLDYLTGRIQAKTMQRRPLANRMRNRRRGVQTLELILVTPVLVLVLLAIVEYGVLNVTHAGITHAATVGARVAGKESTFDLIPTPPDVYDPVEAVAGEVNKVLATVDIAIDGRPGALIRQGIVTRSTSTTHTARCTFRARDVGGIRRPGQSLRRGPRR